MMVKNYSILRLISVLAIVFTVIMLDHLSSPTFAFNTGQGVATSLLQRDETACAPCGAPCPSERRDPAVE